MAALVLLAVATNLSPATAASSTAGLLELGGVGGNFTMNRYAARTGVLGTTVSFAVKIYNVGDPVTQFTVHVGQNEWGTKTQVLAGSGADVTAVATDSSGYYTVPLAYAKSETLTVKVTLPSTVSQAMQSPSGGTLNGVASNAVSLFATDGTFIASADLIESVTPSKGQASTPYDLSVTAKSSSSATAGNQSAVGNPYEGFMDAPLVSSDGSTSTFTATISNHSTSTVSEYVPATLVAFTSGNDPSNNCASFQGSASVTFQSGALSAKQPYIYINLGAGKSVTYTVSVHVSTFGACDGVLYDLTPKRWDPTSGWVDANGTVYLNTSRI